MNWAMIDGGWRISPAFSFWRSDCPGSAILLANGSDRERILFWKKTMITCKHHVGAAVGRRRGTTARASATCYQHHTNTPELGPTIHHVGM